VTAADLLTLARAALSVPAWATIVSGRARPAAFWGSLLASTALDLLDGLLARRLGPTPLGAALDIETDSWLTLSTALAGVRLGRLPWPCAIPPLARYVLTPGSAVDLDRWHHAAGRAQMAVLIGALSPWTPPPRLALALAALQLAALLDVARRRVRGNRPFPRTGAVRRATAEASAVRRAGGAAGPPTGPGPEG
jgi:phosphatidylglycerophosphate synthase